MKTQLNISNKTCKTLAFILSFLLIFEQSGFAQVAAQLGIPGQIAALQGYIVPDAFRPLHLRSLSYDALNNNFKLLLDKGSLKNPKLEEVKGTTKQLLNYFSIGLALPNDAFWVNLRPDGEANIIDSDLARTDVGRVLLEADLQLKKDTARFTSPETPQGKAYWDKLYKKAESLFGTQNITIPTLTRVWILPHEIIISENKTSAYIYKATLRVLLEKDYLKDSSSYQFNDPKQKELNEYSSQLFRELIIPKLTKEVNASKRYANLRQVYYSLIMAQWFKARFKGLTPQMPSRLETRVSLPALIDTRNLIGLASKEPWSATTYFKAYQKSVNEGEYNIQRNQDAPFTSYHQTTKSYFSGGVIASCDIPVLGGATFTKFDPATKTGTSVTSIPTPANPVVNPNRAVGVEVDALGEVNITQAPTAVQGPEVNAEQTGKGREGSKGIILGSGPAEWFVRKFGHIDLGKAIASRFKKNPAPSPIEIPATIEPSFNIKESPEAVDYSVGSFRGVDLEHFVHAQTRLSKKELPIEDLRRVLIKLGLTPDLTEDLAYRKIYEELAKDRYDKEIIDIINGFDPKTGKANYDNPRLDMYIDKQNKNARAQSIYEAVANGLDALGFKIGQFGKGVKQIIDWLQEANIDRIDVYTRKENAKAYQLTILKGNSGQEYIQVIEIPLERFQEIAQEAYGKELDKGTILQVTTRKAIPVNDSQRDTTQHNSLQEIADGIHKHFPYVTSVEIETQIEDQEPQKVNGFKEKVVIVPADAAPYSPEEAKGKSVYVRLNSHSITVLDNGMGMSGDTLSGMFVPKAGTKKPEFLSGEAAQRELGKVKVVHDKGLPHRVSFARNGEVISAIDVPEDIHSDASVLGGLMVEFGLLLDVPESRDNIILPQARPGEETGFQKAIMHAVNKITSHPRLSAQEKARYINTIVIGLDGLIQGNENNSNVVKNIRALIQERLAPVIEELKKEGFIILPHDKQFGKLRIPQDKKDKVLFIHQGLFNWQGAVSLKEVGAEVIPLIKVGGEKRLPLLVVPFNSEHLKGISKFDRLWHTWRQSDRIAMIKTDRFVAIPQELGARLKELAQKKIAKGLDKKEEKEFASLTQLIKIITAEEVVTSYEVSAPKESLTIEEVKFERSRGQVDSEAINDFLARPPVAVKLSRAGETAAVSSSKEAKISLLDVAIHDARNIGDDYLRKGETLLRLAWVMADAKGLEKTKGLFQDVLSLCEHLTAINLNVQKDISDPTVKNEVLIHEAERLLLLAQAELGLGGSGWAQEFDSAVEFIRKADLPIPLLRANLLIRAAQGLSLTHRQDFADELLSEARLLMFRNEALEEWQLKDAVSLLNILGDRGRGDEEVTQLLFRRTAELIAKINREAGINKEAGSSALAYECVKFVQALTKSSIWKNETLGNILDSLERDMGNIYYLPLAKLYALTYFSRNKSAVAARIIAVTFETIKDMEKIGGPYRPVALAEAATILLELGHKEKAEEWFKRALGLIPGSVDSIKAEALIQFSKSPLAKELASAEVQKQKAEIIDMVSEATKEEKVGTEEVLQMAEILEENVSNIEFIDALNEALMRIGKKDLRIALTSPIRFFPLYFLVGTLIDYLTADIGDVVKGYFQVSNKELLKSGKKGIVNLLAQALAEESEGSIPLELLLGKTQTVAGNFTFGQLRLESLSYVLTALAEAGKIDRATAEEAFTAERPTMGSAVTEDKLPEAVVKALEKVEKERRAPTAPTTPTAPFARQPALFSDARPQDAPNRFVIMLDATGASYIKDTKADMPDDALYKVVRRITLDDGNEAFIGYHANGEFDIYAADSTFFRSGPTSASIVDNKGKLVVIERADQNGFKHQSVFDVSSGKYAPSIAENPSLKVSLSASGRFSVHEEADGKLVYYDHAPGKTLERKVILDLDKPFESYRVDRKADVLIMQDMIGKYSLFNLATGEWAPVEVDHVEIDSSGEVAVFKDGDKLGYVWLNASDAQAEDVKAGSKIRVSSDDNYTYLIEVDNKGEVQKFFKFHKGMGKIVQWATPTPSQRMEVIPQRYWEEYGLQKKTIWDREINGIPAPTVPVEYHVLLYTSNSPTEPLDRSITLNGNTALYFSEREGGKAVLIDLENDKEKTLFNAKQMVPLEGGKVWYKTTFANDDIVEVLITKDGGIEAVGSITQDRFFVSQSKKFILRENKNGHSLIDNNGNQIDITQQIPAGYECSDVNGEYFVFVNPKTGEVKYLAPRKAFEKVPEQEAQPTPEEIQREQEELQKTFENWKENVLSKRDAFIARAQAAYQPFLALAPEEFKGEIERIIKRRIEQLYIEQDAEIRRRFQESQANAEPIKLEHLAFDHFAGQMSHINPLLEDYAKSLTRRLSQEPYQVQKEVWQSVFINLFELGTNTALNVDSVDNNLLEALTFGWGVGAQEQINAVGLINNLISSLKESAPHIGIAQARKIVGFLSDFTARNPAANMAVLEAQLGKILGLKQDVRSTYLEKLADAFRGVDNKALNEYLRNPASSSNLGRTREFAVFLTNKVEQLKIREKFIPQGTEKIPTGHNGVTITQIMQLEEQRKKAAADKEAVMSVSTLISAIEDNSLPKPSEESEAKILLDTKVQRESGAYAAEITQNSRDATRGKKGELVIDYYLQNNTDGTQEYVEEATDNGTGALYEVALLIPKSTKAAGEQKELTGFFGTGKYTIFEGVDRVEIISRNSERAYMFTFNIKRDSSGNPVEIKLTGIREVNDPKVSRGVTVRRIKGITNTIPELDQMLAQRTWKTFAGLAQNEDFSISVIGHEGKKEPLTVKKELMAEAEFRAFERGKEEETSFGKMRIYSTEDMPLQIVDKAGLRVCELKEEYLALIPGGLRKHIQELGIVIQIPLPLIRNRSAFEHENEYLTVIQKYVAVQFYRAIAYKALTQVSPQFVFEGFSMDWETNDDYWGSIDLGDKEIVDLAEKINSGNFSAITENELKNLLTEKDRLDKAKKFVKLALLLKVETRKEKRESLLLRRLAIQQERDRRRAEAQARLLREAGMPVNPEDIPDLSGIPHAQQKLSQAKGIETAHEQMRHIKDFLVDSKDYTDSEKELIELARSIAGNFGLEDVVLVNNSVSFAGGFISMGGKNLMAINRSIAHDLGRAIGAHIDAATDTVVHELGHLLEQLMRQEDLKKALKDGYVAHTSNFTHDAVGTFAEAMKYVAAVTLMNQGESSGQIGKRAEVMSINGTTVKVRDSQGNIQAFDLAKPEPSRALDIPALKSRLEAMQDIDQAHKELVLAMVELTLKSPPELRSFGTLIDDLFGFASSTNNLIAIHNAFSDNPIALLHELGEHLIKSGALTMKLEGNILIIHINGNQFDLTLEGETLAIAQKDPANPHYLLRAMQRVIFGEKDRALTLQIKEMQQGNIVNNILKAVQEKGLVGKPFETKLAEAYKKYKQKVVGEGKVPQNYDTWVDVIMEYIDGVYTRFLMQRISERREGRDGIENTLAVLQAYLDSDSKHPLNPETRQAAMNVLLSGLNKLYRDSDGNWVSLGEYLNSYYAGSGAKVSIGFKNLRPDVKTNIIRSLLRDELRDQGVRLEDAIKQAADIMEKGGPDPVKFGYILNDTVAIPHLTIEHKGVTREVPLVAGYLNVTYPLRSQEKDESGHQKVVGAYIQIDVLHAPGLGAIPQRILAFLVHEIDHAVHVAFTGEDFYSIKDDMERARVEGIAERARHKFVQTQSEQLSSLLVDNGFDFTGLFTLVEQRSTYGQHTDVGISQPYAEGHLLVEGLTQEEVWELFYKKTVRPEDVLGDIGRIFEAIAKEARLNESKALFESVLLNNGLEDLINAERGAKVPAVKQEEATPAAESQLPPSSGRLNAPGGIDFRMLPIVIQSVGNLSANIRNSPVNISKLNSIDLDREWKEIEELVNSGAIPQAEKIKEYIQASCCNQSIDKNIDKVILVISDILRLEEEQYVETEPALKDILVVLESASSVQELKAVFIGSVS